MILSAEGLSRWVKTFQGSADKEQSTSLEENHSKHRTDGLCARGIHIFTFCMKAKQKTKRKEKEKEKTHGI
jgi:hypothetical protein